MQPSCIRQNLIPGTSKFFSDYLYHFDKLSGLFPYASWDAQAVVESAKQVRFPAERRAKIVAALREQNGDSPALDKLAQPETVAIVTGQQVGFLSGPAYTVFKALTAVKLAEYLSERGTPAVPIFWLATEDHDLAEVDHAWVFNTEATPTKISIADTVVNGGPVGDVVLNDVPIDALRAALGDLPFASEVVARVEKTYRPGATLGSAFCELVQEILSGLGLLYLNPLAPAIREIGSELLSDVVDQVPELLTALHARDKALAEAGYHSQVFVDSNASLLFLLNEGKRVPLRWSEGQFKTRDKVLTAGDLKARATQLSPNALLRPVMQDFMLPTASYVGGPAEIAYLAQSAVLYEKLLGRMPVMYPRNGFTLLDARAEKLMGKYGLGLTDLLAPHEQVKSRIAAKLVPAGLLNQFDGLKATMSQTIVRLQADLHTFDPSLEAAARKSSAKILYQLEKLSSKAARETLRRDERANKDACYLMNLVYPNKHLQERFYSILPFLAKHGMDLPQQLLGQVQLSCHDHMVRTLA
jgi:bacillithiol biosynthesis cysteine-adding enzyme BshC